MQQHAGRSFPRVLIVGAGFGGLAAAKALKKAPVRVVLIDQRNHHLFQPLLYQVATSGLAAGEVAQPVRRILRKQSNATVVMASVVGVDTQSQRVQLDNGQTLDYDELVLALGARHSYFGHDEWEPYAPGLKTLEDALRIRNSVLLSFEQAERESDPDRKRMLMTVAVIGGGPTGVELAGALAELLHDSFRHEFRRIDLTKARVVLLEAGPTILPQFRNQSQHYALAALERLGVEVRIGAKVESIEDTLLRTSGGQLRAGTVVWAAGVQAAGVGSWLDAKTDRAGRIVVTPELTLPGVSNVHIIGDLAHVETAGGGALPGLAQVAHQQGRYVGRKLAHRAQGKEAVEAFSYRSRGNLATIGRNKAVVEWDSLTLKGYPASLLWAVVHVAMLVGFENRLLVILRWLWIYFTRQRSVRIITTPLASAPVDEDDLLAEPPGIASGSPSSTG